MILAGEQLGKGNPDQAIKIFEELLAVDPNNAEAYNQIGYYYGFRGDYEKAIDNLKRYQFISPDNANPFDSLGENQAYSGRYNEAIENLNRALAIKADFAPAYWHLGVTYEGMGEYAKAVQSYEKAADLDDTDAMRRDYLTLARPGGPHRRRGERVPAVARAHREDPGGPEERLRQGRPGIHGCPSRHEPGASGRRRAPADRAQAQARGPLGAEQQGRQDARVGEAALSAVELPDGQGSRGAGPSGRGAEVLRGERQPPNPFYDFNDRRWIMEARAKVAELVARKGDLDRAEKLIAENRKWNPSWAPCRPCRDGRGGDAPREGAGRLQVMERSRHFETQHRLLLLETLYDAGLSLGAMPDEEALVEDVLGRVVGVLDASRGYLATFGEGGARRAEARVGFPKRPAEAVVAADEFLREVLGSEGAVIREKFKLLGKPVQAAVGVRISGGGRPIGVLVLADKEVRRGGSAGFDEEDRRFLVSLAGLCGMAIENRRHLERLTRDRERLEEENRRLLDETGRAAAGRLFVGDSPAARRVLDLVSRVAPSKISVLVTGESGTGKELVARMIHARSDRAEKPFVAINCAALPETLLESELFGIERGVATGVEARAGRFETAQGGTLFLDEIGDMPLALQSKLLRVLQEREIERVGGRRRVPIDVRVLAATHARLLERIAAGEFREDLYYRLRVVEIELPPLRERREDIPKLVRYFLERFAAREGREVPNLDRDAYAALLSHDFPGNIRELENLLEGAAALSQGGTIRREDLQWLPRPAARGEAAAAVAGGDDEIPDLRALQERHIQRVLRLAGGNKSRAARLLGISRRTLYRKRSVGH